MYIVAGIIVAIVVFLSVGYVKSPPNTATIISGPGKHPRVLIGKAGFKIPFLERVDRMGIGQIDIDIETEDYIPTKDFINIQVDAIAQVAVDTSPENIEIAMRNFLNKSSDDVRNTITKSLQGNLREIIGTMELKDICQNKAEFSEQVKSNAKEDIAQLGICILSFNVQNIKDKDGLINDLGIDNPVFLIHDFYLSPRNGHFFQRIGQNAEHIKLYGNNMDAIGFDMAERFINNEVPKQIDIIGTLSFNYFNNRKKIQIEIFDYLSIKKEKTPFIESLESLLTL